MRVGIDVDGVLANYTQGYYDLALKVTGKRASLVPEHWYDLGELTKADDKLVWANINDLFFWQTLAPIRGIQSLSMVCVKHQVYFVTTRPENRARQVQEQTAAWLNRNGVLYPSVIITPSNNKKAIIDALALDAYIDDKPENLEGLTCQCYLPRRTYNGQGSSEEGVSKPFTYTEVRDFNEFAEHIL